ncbi:amidohydrolase family protein [Caballeronia ptereochthonis]|uniref:Amidohydrolase n=1 Tax=Caballeronia ptereochthonis TaxID=1777144 RepID=A0A158B806_9BURK|nr:amidohydrolase family protein [Caballeronia ptereochthonis]SAK66208.1 amidohydrolase [Caballeronia ptereochthonis]
MNDKLAIIDCHQHFYDATRLRYPVFEERSAGFEALVGDYAAMPRVYLPEDYARDTQGFDIVGTLWAEFISSDPSSEVRWASEMLDSTAHAAGMIAVIDFAAPDVERTLDAYASVERIRCVRQHMAWHPSNPSLRFAPRPDLMTGAQWLRGIALLRGRRLVCEIEVFGSQLRDLTHVVRANPEIQFVLPVMGWPLDVSREGRAAWKSDLAALAGCPNVAIKIFGLECIFGIHWTLDETRPWMLDAIECFGPARSMFASHMPIASLACGFQQLYDAYLQTIEGFALDEKRQMLHDTAMTIYRLA